MRDRFFIFFQEIIPQHTLSRFVGKLADCKVRWIKDLFIGLFVKAYDVNMQEAVEEHPFNYPSFNAFFTRALKPSAREICPDPNQLACPVDGTVSQIGDIDKDHIFQAKGHHYNLTTLIGGDPEQAEPFIDGHFATLYLAPSDYHRVHMPVEGKLTSMVYVPGDLYSVNGTTAENVNELFARNERLVCFFETAAGPMAMVLVGAMIVAGIETVWAGQVAPPLCHIQRTHYDKAHFEQVVAQEPLVLTKGEEMGRFKLGSTVILLFGKDAIDWGDKFAEGVTTRLGEPLAEILLED